MKEVQKFLGLVSYYWQFIKNFARVAVSLYLLVRKKEKWKWEKEQEKAFQGMKKAFILEPILVVPDLNREM